MLASAVTETFDGTLGDEAALIDRVRITYERDGLGLLRVRWTNEIDKRFPEAVGDSGVSWFRRSLAALRAARKLVDRELPRRIRAWVERVAPTEPVYGLGLMWSVDAPDLPPSLGLGTVRELRDWRDRNAPGFELRACIWNPAEFACFDPVPAELVEDAALEEDWSAAPTPADCFCIFVIADELDDTLSRQLGKTVPAELQRRIAPGLV